MRRGMTHVTISDHNTIEGVLEIAHLDNVFISEELTTYFPEDGCKLHVLAWNIIGTFTVVPAAVVKGPGLVRSLSKALVHMPLK